MGLIESAQLQFENCIKAAGPAGPSRVFRERAWSEYLRQGLPGRKSESWKYSSLSGFSQKQWRTPSPVTDIPRAALEMADKFKAEFDVLLMVNGRMQTRGSSLKAGAGYQFLPSENHSPDLQFADGFTSMAAAVHSGGYVLQVPDGAQVARPLLVVHVTTAESEPVWSSTLNRITIGQGAALQLAEIFAGGGEFSLRTDITSLQMADSASLTWARSQSENLSANHFSEVQCNLERSARLSIAQINGGAAWARGSLKVALRGEGAGANILGLTFARDRQHMDQRIQINHFAPRTDSTQLFKGVLKDNARGVLNGRSYIAPDAQKVNSSQLNHNLLLSPTAEADTQPELEIFADDVKANHGASVGRLDDEKLFYLLSRAIPRTEAVRILARAFVADVLMKIPTVTLRSLLSARVEELLPDFATQMEAAP